MAEQGVTEFTITIVMNLVTPKVVADLELLFNQREVGLLNRNSHLARTLAVTEFTNVRNMIWSHFFVILMSDLNDQQTHLRGIVC